MTKDLAPDLLSDLPTEIIEKILTLLPIRDAIKTSILASKWRYRWTSLPCLVFEDKYLTCPEKETINNLSKLVTHVLLFHKGPIHKFKLSTAYNLDCWNLEQWLLFVSGKGILEFSLKFREFHRCHIPFSPRIPSCLFSCQLLTRLELNHCELNPPLAPKGFPCLKSLNLTYVSVPRSGVEDIVSHCPLLENFLWVGNGRLDMRIHAPKLKRLGLLGSAGELCFEDSPLLAKIHIGLNDKVAERSFACKFARFIGGLYNLEELTGVMSFIKVLSVGIDQLPTSVVYNHLTFISLKIVSFKDMTSVPVVLRLMLSSPSLRELTLRCNCIGSTAPDAANICLGATIFPSDCTFNHLEVVKLTESIGLPLEMKLIEFVLGKSPALKSLVIEPYEHLKEGEGNVLQEAVRFFRASQSADVLLLRP